MKQITMDGWLWKEGHLKSEVGMRPSTSSDETKSEKQIWAFEVGSGNAEC